jgi:hypothetical protein
VTSVEFELWNGLVETGGGIAFSFNTEAVYLRWLMLNLFSEKSVVWGNYFKSFTKHWVKWLSLSSFGCVKRLYNGHVR